MVTVVEKEIHVDDDAELLTPIVSDVVGSVEDVLNFTIVHTPIPVGVNVADEDVVILAHRECQSISERRMLNYLVDAEK